MSIKERRREKKDTTRDKNKDINSINDWLDNVNVDSVEDDPKKELKIIKTEESIVESPQENTIDFEKDDIVEETQVDPIELFLVKLPAWTKKPWMYVKPVHDGQLSSWVDSWKSLILEYSRTLKIHIVNLSQLNTEHPFTNQNNGKSLTFEQLHFILIQMVSEGLAKWMDDSQISARIYYHTDEEWAKRIIDYLIQTGYAAEVMTFHELQHLKQDWSTLPHIELRQIFEILITNGRAKWVGNGKDTVSFIL